jgi:hypothetical protein
MQHADLAAILRVGATNRHCMNRFVSWRGLRMLERAVMNPDEETKTPVGEAIDAVEQALGGNLLRPDGAGHVLVLFGPG